jgi:hypothetical protein
VAVGPAKAGFTAIRVRLRSRRIGTKHLIEIFSQLRFIISSRVIKFANSNSAQTMRILSCLQRF